MRILVACEYSGSVRDAFTALGHDATSCDLLPSDTPGKHHQGSVLDILHDGWDLVVAHPPCTYLSSSGLHWNHRHAGRAAKTEAAVEFARVFFTLKCPYAIENPIGCLSTRIRKPDQIVQPWQFGHRESKSTCLWLQGLPKLEPTNVLPLPDCGYWENQTPSRQNKLGPSANRAHVRSKTYDGIAAAMAAQWSKALNA